MTMGAQSRPHSPALMLRVFPNSEAGMSAAQKAVIDTMLSVSRFGDSCRQVAQRYPRTCCRPLTIANRSWIWLLLGLLMHCRSGGFGAAAVLDFKSSCDDHSDCSSFDFFDEKIVRIAPDDMSHRWVFSHGVFAPHLTDDDFHAIFLRFLHQDRAYFPLPDQLDWPTAIYLADRVSTGRFSAGAAAKSEIFVQLISVLKYDKIAVLLPGFDLRHNLHLDVLSTIDFDATFIERLVAPDLVHAVQQSFRRGQIQCKFLLDLRHKLFENFVRAFIDIAVLTKSGDFADAVVSVLRRERQNFAEETEFRYDFAHGGGKPALSLSLGRLANLLRLRGVASPLGRGADMSALLLDRLVNFWHDHARQIAMKPSWLRILTQFKRFYAPRPNSPIGSAIIDSLRVLGDDPLYTRFCAHLPAALQYVYAGPREFSAFLCSNLDARSMRNPQHLLQLRKVGIAFHLGSYTGSYRISRLAHLVPFLINEFADSSLARLLVSQYATADDQVEVLGFLLQPDVLMHVLRNGAHDLFEFAHDYDRVDLLEFFCLIPSLRDALMLYRYSSKTNAFYLVFCRGAIQCLKLLVRRLRRHDRNQGGRLPVEMALLQSDKRILARALRSHPMLQRICSKWLEPDGYQRLA